MDTKDETIHSLSKILKTSIFKELLFIFLLVMFMISAFTGFTYMIYDLNKKQEARLEKVEKQQEQTNQMMLGVVMQLQQKETNWEK